MVRENAYIEGDVVNEQSWMTSDLAKLGHCTYVGVP